MVMDPSFEPGKLYPKPKQLTAADRRRMETEVPKKLSRSEAREKKELEESRKEGTAQPEKDELGEIINPHIPSYIASVPWYIDKEKKPSLSHQHKPKDSLKHTIGDWYHRGMPAQKSSTRFRKGACENCGAMTHKKRDCLERPRKRGAKWTGEEIAPDEFVQPQLDLGFEGKRDRWNGYDPARHRFEVFEEYQKIDIARKAINAQRLQNEIESGTIDEPDVAHKDDDKYEEDEVKMHNQMNVDQRQTVSVRNLRIREDTAKYLRNLDPESAFYDPKTRSMRENPYEKSDKGTDEVDFAGENFVRHTGESVDFAKAQVFAWDAMDKGVDVHFQAEPTKAAVLRKTYAQKKKDHSSKLKQSVLDKYGGMEHLKAPPKELLLAQTENYVEYSRTGQVIKGQERAKVKSRYEEDVLIGNHTAVWGSYWEAGDWGYACCKSTVKNSYCVANKERKGSSESNAIEMAPPKLVPQIIRSEDPSKSDDSDSSSSDSSSSESEDENAGKSLVEIHQEKKKNKKKMSKKELKKAKKEEKKAAKKAKKEADKKREQEIEEAIRKERERVKEVDKLMATDERKRKYNSMAAVSEPSEAELEAFKRTRVNRADPMANFLSK